jgi:nicotinamidase-related amidase
MNEKLPRHESALVVIDVQRGFDEPLWGRRNNPHCEDNAVALLRAWQSAGRPVVLVRHDSLKPESPLRAGTPGNAFKPPIQEAAGMADLMFGKHVNSAFHGSVDLHHWLTGRGIGDLVIAGIQTNMCVETTARVGGNLGYRVQVPLDATHTFDLDCPDGDVVTADELVRITATNLQGGGFATVTSTADVLAAWK